MLITSAVEICIQHLGRVEEIVFTARRSGLGSRDSVRLSVRPSHVCIVTNQRTYRRYFYTTWKGNPSSQMWFFVQLCSIWQEFNWLKASRSPSVIAELLVEQLTTESPYFTMCVKMWITQLKIYHFTALTNTSIHKCAHFYTGSEQVIIIFIKYELWTGVQPSPQCRDHTNICRLKVWLHCSQPCCPWFSRCMLPVLRWPTWKSGVCKTIKRTIG